MTTTNREEYVTIVGADITAGHLQSILADLFPNHPQLTDSVGGGRYAEIALNATQARTLTDELTDQGIVWC